MRKTLLIFLTFFSINIVSQDFYNSSYAKERYGNTISELKKWGFHSRFKYNKQDFIKYKDSITVLDKIEYAIVNLKKQVKINDIFKDLSKLKNLKNIKFETSSFLREDIKQKEFPKQFTLLKKLETIILYGNPKWNLNKLFLEFSKIETLKNISFISFSDSIFLNENFLKIKKLEGIKFQARLGPKIPKNIYQLKNLKTFILLADKYPNAKIEFTKIKNLDNLLVSIYKPEKNEYSSIINNFTSLKKLTVNGKIGYSKLLFSSISKNKKLETLRISNNYLNKFPKEIGSLNNLKSFYSSNNKFSKELPKEFYNITTLKNIEIQGSNLEVISNDIIKLKNLETLKLYFNKIKNIPKGISGLSNLKKLYLNYNQIKELPNNIGNLGISYLSLNNNLLEDLPTSIVNLKNLDSLYLEENYIKELPKKIGNLKKLKFLNLELNNFKELPKSFEKLKILEYLNISRNKITHLPTNFGNLSKLKEFNAEFCLLKKLPKTFGNLKSLEKLTLTNNNLQSLSKNFGKLKNLNKLYLNNRSYYGFIYNRKFKKDTTISLKVLENNITKLPRSFSNLSKLKYLELSLNKNIDEENLFNILKESKFKNYSIRLQKCNIKKLPVTDWNSIKVKSFNLRDNFITKIPKNIINAPFLNELNLNKNKGVNTYRGNKSQLNLLFVEEGFIKEKDLEKTDELVIAYAKTANRKVRNKEYKKGVEYAEKAYKINKILTSKHLYEDSYIEALYYSKNYSKAIEFANIQIQKDTSQIVRILNSIIPNFNYKAKSQLALGDTIQGIKTLEIVSKKFNDNKWTEAGMLSKKIKQDSIAKKYFTESYQFYKSYLKNKPNDWGYHLSLIEAYIIGNEIGLAKIELNKIKILNIDNKNYKSLITYFEIILKIIKEDNFKKDFLKLKSNLKENNIELKGWSFKLIKDWVQLSKLKKEQKNSIKKLNILFD